MTKKQQLENVYNSLIFLSKHTYSFLCLPFFLEKHHCNVLKSFTAERKQESPSGSSSAPLFATKEHTLMRPGQEERKAKV